MTGNKRPVRLGGGGSGGCPAVVVFATERWREEEWCGSADDTCRGRCGFCGGGGDRVRWRCPSCVLRLDSPAETAQAG